jgi:hypothetical protein
VTAAHDRLIAGRSIHRRNRLSNPKGIWSECVSARPVIGFIGLSDHGLPMAVAVATDLAVTDVRVADRTGGDSLRMARRIMYPQLRANGR